MLMGNYGKGRWWSMMALGFGPLITITWIWLWNGIFALLIEKWPYPCGYGHEILFS
jgi:hypothetical protein